MKGQNLLTLLLLKVLHWPAQLLCFQKVLRIHASSQERDLLLQHILGCLEAMEGHESGCLSDANEVGEYPDRPEKEHF